MGVYTCARPLPIRFRGLHFVWSTRRKLEDLLRLLSDVKCSLYADDPKIRKPIDCENSRTLQVVFDVICEWSNANGLDLKLSKCHVIPFTQNLTVAKVLSVLGLLKRVSKDVNDQQVSKIMYCALVRSHLECA